MKTILIVFHSLTGGTRQMADAAARAAEAQTDVQVHLLRAREAGPDDLLNADGYMREHIGGTHVGARYFGRHCGASLRACVPPAR
jgi:multimeric flavodoxin WrbA